MRNRFESPANRIPVPNPFEDPRKLPPPLLRGFDDRIITKQSRIIVFGEMQTSLREKRDPDFSIAEEFYAENCGHIVPHSDFEVIYRRAKSEGKRPPTVKKYYKSRALEILAMDIEVAKKFALGVEIEGETRGLEWLI